MNQDLTTPQICVLKMNLKCEACQKKVKKRLQKLHGVHTINIDANEGKVTISSTIDPHILVKEFAMAGKKAELIWDLQNNAQINGFDHLQRAQLAQIQELAKNPRLKQLELTQSRKINMIFKEIDDSSHGDHDHSVKVITDNFHEPKLQTGPPSANVAGPGPAQCGNGGNQQGGSSSSSSSSGGCGGGCSHAMKKTPSYCHHDFEFNCGGNRWIEEKAQRPLLPSNYVLPPPSPPPNYPAYVPHTQQPINTLYADVNCGEEHKTCMIM